MAQGKVTDFFSSRKKNPSLQPSKRRKVEISSLEINVSTLEKTNLPSSRTLMTDHDQAVCDDKRKENTVFSPLQTRAARKAKTVSMPKKTRTRKTKTDTKQALISDSFMQLAQAPEDKATVTLTEDVTSAWDEHDELAQTSTPQKQQTDKVNGKTRKRTRNGKTTEVEETLQDEATPEKRQQPAVVLKSSTKAKKKLDLVESTRLDKKVEEPVQVASSAEKIINDDQKSVKSVSANVAAALAKCKAFKADKSVTKKTSVEDMKEKLNNVSNLGDLKLRLAQMKETREKIKTPKLHKFEKIEIKTEGEVTAPAYERFHHLASPAPPTLSLPYKYRLLVEQFRGMDQVVSMLHNRNEICTFSKLKAAVQELTKRNFEKQHIGQIKTVYPDAYELRQEKGLQNMQGFRDPGYQLTVEARLHAEDDKCKGRGTFLASHLLTRRNVFHNGLIDIVKKHHKEFLANLSRPLSIPDDKITRWHPKFPLDEVPDVLESPLPQPPDVQTLQTAKDVLESTRGKVDPKVEAALTAAVKQEKSSSAPNTVPKPVATAASKPASGNLKGVPQSLLEKIRAKEAANLASALTRDPKQEKRLVMMKRLPDIMRIIRSQFVTEKKPSLPIDSVIQRVLDSYKSCIAPGDVEPHISLCIELVPEWISSVKIKQGQYLKIDRNIELQNLTDKINNIAKGKM